MAVELRPEPPFEDVLLVTRNMRQRDRDEIFATRYDDNPEHLALDTVATGAFRWGAYLDGAPVAMIGAAPRWPNVWSVWAYGTDDWNKVVLKLTRHVLRFMIPALENAGVTRVDCMVLDTHEDAKAWLSLLGLRPEKTMDKWGKNGEKFVCFMRTR